MAERRMYMPITGLILVVIGLAARLHLTGNRQRILASACVVLVAGLSWQRSAVWSSPLAFWDDCLRRVPGNLRARMGYGSALLALHECKPAVQEFIRARSDDPNNPTLEWNLASAYECDNQYEPALPLFQSFAGAHPSADAWNHIAYNQLKLRQLDEAADSVQHALRLDPGNVTSYTYQGFTRLAMNNMDGAREDFQHALELDPDNAAARRGLRLFDQLKDK